ncbi:MAG: dienelactone hydrolase family protein [Oscillospiraceae bacterium]|nr:dienelactone hydrolase family protein [Oscillospiraceae bacterium]
MNRYTDTYICNNVKMSYEVFSPDNCENMPLLVFLHGAGERGTTTDNVNRWALPRLITEGVKVPAVVLCPQCPQEYVWDNLVREIKGLTDMIAEKYKIKKDRICITGASMGGFGTWSMGMAYPEYFSAIAPVAGGGMVWRTPNLKTTPVYAVHGDADNVVPLVYSQLMVDGVNKNGGNAQLTVLKGFGHGDGIDEAYENTDLIEWILKQRKTDFEKVAEAFSEYF